MAYEENLQTISLLASSDVAVYTGVPGMPGSASPNAGYQFRVVKLGATAREVTRAVTTANEVPIGVLQNKPQATGAPATVAISGVSLVECGGTVTANSVVKVDSTGRIVDATLPGDAALVVGVALETGAVTNLVPVLLKLKS
jgi:hypothetical protein